jgi:hypothetical protein
MKKVIASILAVIYLSTSMGATVHLHYCMGRLTGWGLVNHEGKDCMTCGMSMKRALPGCAVDMKSCCHDEHKHIQGDRAQEAAHGWADGNLAPALVASPLPVWSAPVLTQLAEDRPVANGPPPPRRVFLRNCNFRI